MVAVAAFLGSNRLWVARKYHFLRDISVNAIG
jgi:hypothetical protein